MKGNRGLLPIKNSSPQSLPCLTAKNERSLHKINVEQGSKKHFITQVLKFCYHENN